MINIHHLIEWSFLITREWTKGTKKKSRQDSDTTTTAHGHRNNIPSGFLIELEVRRALIDDGQGANGGRDEEPERRAIDCPRDRILANMHNNLDESKGDSTKASRDDPGHP
jgi:hypothetical protein